MTRASRAIRASLLACSLLSCDRQPQPAGSAAPVPLPRPLERIQVALPSTEFAQLTLDVMSTLGKPVTLADWKAQHGSDLVEEFKSGQGPSEKWCARVMSLHRVDADSKATRTVYFFPMEDRTPPEQCVSGFVSTEVDFPDSKAAIRVYEQARKQIDGAIGAGETNADVVWPAFGTWTGNSLWERDGVAVVAAISRNDQSQKVVMLALGKASGLDIHGDRREPKK